MGMNGVRQLTILDALEKKDHSWNHDVVMKPWCGSVPHAHNSTALSHNFQLEEKRWPTRYLSLTFNVCRAPLLKLTTHVCAHY